ncbi:MAG: hypothetical protein ACYDA8_00435 [Deferrisomatales bacterium]
MHHRRLLAAAAVLLYSLGGRADAAVTQRIELKPGWNAVFLEVQPEPVDPASVFRDLPVESAWTWFPSQSAVQFIQNPAEPGWGAPGWGVYFKAPERAKLNSLFAVHAGRAYLVKLGGAQAVTWTVTGAPSAQPLSWVPNSFNLVGFRVSPTAPPSFASFFAGSPAHAGQAVYRLNGAGVWEFVNDPAAAGPRSGEAYWVYCQGASAYQGALEVQLPTLDGLDFGAFADSLTLALRNASSQPLTVRLTALTADVDLAYRTLNTATGAFEWPPLSTLAPLVLAPGSWKSVRLAVRRESLAAERAESALEITDSLGTRLRVPVRVAKETAP